MSTKPFQFSEAARIYVKNLDVVREMREETFRNIAEFGDKLLQHLPIELGKEHLCHKKTVTQGTYAGGDIHYLWIGRDEKEEWKRKIGLAYLVFPIPGKVISEEQLSTFGIFDIVGNNRIRVMVVFEGVPKDVRDRLMSLTSNSELGELIEKEPERFSLWIDFDQTVPLVSATKRIATLLRAIRNAQKEQF